MQKYEQVGFVDLVFTTGTVFEGMDASREQVERFLRSEDLGNLRRPERELLLDLRSATEHLIQSAPADLDAAYVVAVNRRFGRTGALRPGDLRLPEQQIGVDTVHGRHEPPAMTLSELEDLVERAYARRDPMDVATALAVQLARAQPFTDGNKRTAWFTAAAVLLPFGFTMPVPTTPGFSSALAHGYLTGDMSSVAATMRSGIVQLPLRHGRPQRPRRPNLSARTPRDQRETDALLRAMEEDR